MLRLITVMATSILLSASSMATEVMPYGTFNYKMSHDQDSSGNASSKLENNSSLIGVDIVDVALEGSNGLSGFANVEVGLDVDDSGSDTFDSRTAFVGIENSGGAAISLGRQAHPYTDVHVTNSFEVYGGSAFWKYADRSSNSVKVSSGPISAMGIVDGSSGESGIDVWDLSVSHSIDDLNLAVGYTDDLVNDISYWAAGASTTVGDLSLAGTYSIKDAATDLSAYEATVGWKAATVGYGDKEGTGTYYTVGLSHGLSDSLSVYAEYQQEQLDTNSNDLEHYSIGTKFSF